MRVLEINTVCGSGSTPTDTAFPQENCFSTLSRGFPCGKLVKNVENYKMTIIR